MALRPPPPSTPPRSEGIDVGRSRAAARTAPPQLDAAAQTLDRLDRALSATLWGLGLVPVLVAATTAAWMAYASRPTDSALGTVLEAAFLAAALSACAMLVARRLLAPRVAEVVSLAEGRSRKVRHVDPVTGRLNRLGLQRHLDQLARRGLRDTAGVVMIDLERFRLLNATLGQHQGDEVLREVARRIQSVLPQQAIARLEGDVFAAVVSPLLGDDAARSLARNVQRAIEPELNLGQRTTRLSARIGIALATAARADGADEPSADELLARAEAALRAAKAAGAAPFRVFDDSLLAPLAQRLELETALRRATENEAFTLQYQPIVGTDGRTVEAVEALLRCDLPSTDASGGPTVGPATFIPLLEESGLIVPVGRWVLREACRRAQGWVMRGAPPFMLSINVSPIQFAQVDFVPQVLATLEATGWPARQLQLEVTEGLLLDPTPDLQARLDALADAGISLALDDFGMGYSSLAYLERFRLRALKIDRMFVIDVPVVARDTAIVRAMVELGHALGLHVTAEGVESSAQWAALSNLGCDSLQGYHFARPMSGPALLERLRAGLPAKDAFVNATDWSTTMVDRLDSELTR